MKTSSPNDFGKKYLVESCQKIKIKDFISKFKIRLKESLLEAELETVGIKIELTTTKTFYNGIRFWFKCPLCQLRVGVLFKHPLSNEIGCRNCLNLDYKKHRYAGMIENN